MQRRPAGVARSTPDPLLSVAHACVVEGQKQLFLFAVNVVSLAACQPEQGAGFLDAPVFADVDEDHLPFSRARCFSLPSRSG